ncbi:MAG: transcriptional regulator, GntR family [Rhodobacteraceae bacterium HLUCCA12]|nr:MAG: transcriptional regulator, GntR family [Rhodobacteraceae bacterium HLUCCA12]
MGDNSSTGRPSGAPHRPDRARYIADVLEHNILTGHYGPGDRLPSEADLCRHFEVSRPTLREALGRLSALGLLHSRRGAGGGAFVTRPNARDLTTRIATQIALGTTGADSGAGMIEARLQILAGCARLAALRRAPIDDLRAEIDRQSDFAIDDAAFRAACRRFYHAVAQGADNTVMTVLAQAVIEAEAAQAGDTPRPTRMRARMLSFHVRLANAIAAGRPADADAALGELLDYELQCLDAPQGAPAGGAEPTFERPPRMRDLRPPPVQRLTPENGAKP